MDNQNSNIIINEESIIDFIKNNSMLNQIETQIGEATTHVTFSSQDEWIKNILKLLKSTKQIPNINSLEELMKEHKEEIVNHCISLYKVILGEKPVPLSSGLSIIGLVRILKNEHIK